MIPRPWVVLLAAGGSLRFGRQKQLARIDGETLLRRTACIALASEPAGCVVVLGRHAARLAREVRDLPVAIVVNRAWRSGLGRSLATGIAALPASARGALILLADQVSIGPADLELLAAAWRLDPQSIVAARAGRVLRPPAILPRRLFGLLLRLRGDRGARDILRNPARRIVAIEIATAAVDIDRPEDFDRIRRSRAPVRSRRSARSSRSRRSKPSGAT